MMSTKLERLAELVGAGGAGRVALHDTSKVLVATIMSFASVTPGSHKRELLARGAQFPPMLQLPGSSRASALGGAEVASA
jgi:hypothetical protein